MSWVEIIGWSATAVGALLGFPQLFRLLRTRNVEGLSLLAWQAVLVLNVIWFTHGVRIGQGPQIVTNSVALASTLPLLVLLARATRRSLFAVVAPSLVAAAVIIAVDFTLGSLAFGLVATIPGLMSSSGQSVELVRARRVDGVAPVFLALAWVNQCLWLTWALLVHDPGTIVACSITLTITAFNLIWFILRRLGLRALFVRASDEPVLPCTQPALARS